jgi:lipoate-protein ligase A
VIVDDVPNNGTFNMAMDAAMLHLAAARDVSVIRIYRWSEPTVTLGYFQGATTPPEATFPGLSTVRRLSGGGAILHDRELTYSAVLPTNHPVRHNPSEAYTLIHRNLIELMIRCGVPCSLRSEFQESPPTTSPDFSLEQTKSTEPFLCFLRSNPNDIVHASGVKIVGSAQRRRRGITLQHGSILLSASPASPDLPGLQQLQPNWNSDLFHAELPQAIVKSVAERWRFRTYTSEELATAAESRGEFG